MSRQAKAAPRLETAIQAEILQYLLSKGYFVWRSNNAPVYDPRRGVFRAAGKYAPRGLPDIQGLLAWGVTETMRPACQGLLIEVKRPGQKLRPDQKAFLDRAESLGHLAFMAQSLDDVKNRGL